MDDIEYIKILTQKEIEEFVSSIAIKYDSQSLLSQNYLKENKDLLIKAYEDYETEIINECKNEIKIFNNRVKLWNDKECLCGQKLRFNDSYNFWGCPNYMDKTKAHETFAINQNEKFAEKYKNIKVRLNHNWSTTILKRCNLQNKIKAKELLIFYNSNGLADLREKYDYNNSLESISGFVYANQNSKKEEIEIREFFAEYFDKISYQVYIKFKRKGNPERVKIIDLIVSDASVVYLIEIKRHNIYIDEKQLDLYFELVNYLMEAKNDKRTLKSLFIVNDFFESSYNPKKCIQFEQLKLINTKNDIIGKLNDGIYK